MRAVGMVDAGRYSSVIHGFRQPRRCTATAASALTTFAGQVFTSAEEMDLLITLATVLLAAASITGLVQLLGSERPLAAKATVQA